jgi:hypothetical protein
MSGLKRFIDAQKQDFKAALQEIRTGRKRSHWMWYIFPQIQGAGLQQHFPVLRDPGSERGGGLSGRSVSREKSADYL